MGKEEEKGKGKGKRMGKEWDGKREIERGKGLEKGR